MYPSQRSIATLSVFPSTEMSTKRSPPLFRLCHSGHSSVKISVQTSRKQIATQAPPFRTIIRLGSTCPRLGRFVAWSLSRSSMPVDAECQPMPAHDSLLVKCMALRLLQCFASIHPPVFPADSARIAETASVKHTLPFISGDRRPFA